MCCLQRCSFWTATKILLPALQECGHQQSQSELCAPAGAWTGAQVEAAAGIRWPLYAMRLRPQCCGTDMAPSGSGHQEVPARSTLAVESKRKRNPERASEMCLALRKLPCRGTLTTSRSRIPACRQEPRESQPLNRISDCLCSNH